MENTISKADLFLEHIRIAKNEYYKSTNRAPNTITLHYIDVDILKRNYAYHLNQQTDGFFVFGLKVLRSEDIRQGFYVIGEEDLI